MTRRSDNKLIEKRVREFARNPEKETAHHEALLRRIKERLPRIKKALSRMGDEDRVYRFYYQSYKVFDLQQDIKEGCQLIKEIGGETDPVSPWYLQIVKEGTEGNFREDTNEHWLEQTRPIVEAFWHTKYFLTQLARYGRELESAPRCLPSGWTAVLCLFRLR
jgi:hypothetical protein